MKIRQIIIHEPITLKRYKSSNKSTFPTTAQTEQEKQGTPKRQILPNIVRYKKSHEVALNTIQDESQSNSKYSIPDNLQRKMKTLPTAQTYHNRISVEKAERIYDSINQSNIKSLIIVNKKDTKLNEQQLQNYQQAQHIYKAMIQNKTTKNVQEIINLIETLKQQNHLFHKLSDILVISLFKKGRVRMLKQGEILYSQNEEIKSFFIVLWGEIKLKQIYRKKIRYCLPGNILCEEAVINSNNKQYNNGLFSNIKLVKGNFTCQQTAKAYTNCGVLEISERKYEEIKKIFAQNGEKDKISTFQAILTRNTSKIKKFRK